MKDENILYKGYYKNILLCVSTSKKIVLDYLINTRKIDKKSALLEKEYMINDSILLHYEDYILEDCYDIYLPARDVSMINKEYDNFVYKYKDNIDYMKEYLKVLYPLVSKEEYDIILETIKIFVKYQNKPKKNIKLQSIFYLRHPLFHMPIDEYLIHLGMYREDDQLTRRYEFLLSESNEE